MKSWKEVSSFENVTFTYPMDKEPMLKDVILRLSNLVKWLVLLERLVQGNQPWLS